LTYAFASIPRLSISATSVRRWAVSELVVGVAALRQLGMIGSEMLVVIKALLICQPWIFRIFFEESTLTQAEAVATSRRIVAWIFIMEVVGIGFVLRW
jgi:hypothetical protein